MPKQTTAAAVPTAQVVDESGEGGYYLSAKDIVLNFVLRGEDSLDAYNLSNKGHLLRKAIAICRVEGREDTAQSLAKYANSRGIVIWPGRGRRGAPQEGELRSYKAQKLKDMDPFIRLPVKALGVDKGQVVTVSFRAGVIEVRSGA